MKKTLYLTILIMIGCYFNKIEKIKTENLMISTEILKSPNYVTTNKKDEKHYLKPIIFHDTNLEQVKLNLLKILKEMNGKILVNNKNYIKVGFYSKFFKFEDIAEFEISEKSKLIYFRSGAQTGWYDFGVNRKRIEKIKKTFQKDLQS